MDNQRHEHWMRRALGLARMGIGLASPNPCVGAVIVGAEGRVLGEGFHTYEGLEHAELLAIDAARAAGHDVRGALLYINLEPCCHQGRTPPCVQAVVAGGITRVVVAMRDPNPRVSGQGIEQLRSHGVEVTEGLLRNEAQKLNESFAKFIRTRTPLVTLKAAMTLDGKIAPPSPAATTGLVRGGGVSGGWISSEAARAHAQELRHASDAIMVGMGTVAADDPLLTDRTGLPRRRPLLRIVVDSLLRLPLDSRLVKTAQQDVLVLCALAEEKTKRALEERGIRVEQVALPVAPAASASSAKVRQMPVRRRTGTGKPIREESAAPVVHYARPDLRRVIARLGEMEITSLLIEGGAMVNWAALSAGIVDKVFLYYAPKILAGTGAVPFAAGAGFGSLGEAARVSQVSIHHFGEDFAVEGYLRDPYAEAGDQER